MGAKLYSVPKDRLNALISIPCLLPPCLQTRTAIVHLPPSPPSMPTSTTMRMMPSHPLPCPPSAQPVSQPHFRRFYTQASHHRRPHATSNECAPVQDSLQSLEECTQRRPIQPAMSARRSGAGLACKWPSLLQSCNSCLHCHRHAHVE